MSKYISEQIRQSIAEQAGFRCEYCKVRAIDTFIGFEIDHIISQKHGGGNEVENLAFACPHCNSYKGSDLTTFLDSYQDIVPVFNPRLQLWSDHFTYENGVILARSKTGQATIKLLQLNHPDRIIQRAILEESGYWP